MTDAGIIAAQEVTALWTWNGNTPPPNAGQFRSDSRNWNAATVLAFARTDKTGADRQYVFSAMAEGDIIHAEVTTNTAVYHDWTVVGNPLVQPDGSWNVTVESTGGSSTQASSGQDCKLVFSTAATPPDPENPQLKPTANDIISVLDQVDAMHADIMVLRSGISREAVLQAVLLWYQAYAYFAAANTEPPPA